MGRYTYVEHVNAPPEVVFDLWTNLDRMHEWVGGVTKVTDVTGPIDVAGTRYTVWFGNMSSVTEITDVERPRRYAGRFGNRLLAGMNTGTFEPDGSGTRLTQTFVTQGFIPGVMGWIFGHGSYRGSFRGELREFVRLAEADAAPRSPARA